MKVTGSYTLDVPRQQVWDALQDPAVLARTLPGCESLEVTGPDAFAATVTAGIANVRGSYQGTVRLSDKVDPSSYRLLAEGAGAPGTIRADAQVRLEDGGGSTTVHYDADAVIGGMIGGVGQRVLAGVAKKSAEEFFGAVERELVYGPPTAPAPAIGGPTPAVDGGPPTPEIGQVFRGAPAAPGRERRGVELLLAAVAGAGIALVGVLVGHRLARRPRRP
jgi:uncharacterized protein